MRRFLAVAAVAAMLPALGACASNDAPRIGPEVGTEDVVAVRVTNQNWSDMIIYVQSRSASHRLGRVTSMATANFRVPRTLANGTSDLQLVARPLADPRNFSSPPVVVWPGETIDFQIENQISLSTATVWR